MCLPPWLESCCRAAQSQCGAVSVTLCRDCACSTCTAVAVVLKSSSPFHRHFSALGSHMDSGTLETLTTSLAGFHGVSGGAWANNEHLSCIPFDTRLSAVSRWHRTSSRASHYPKAEIPCSTACSNVLGELVYLRSLSVDHVPSHSARWLPELPTVTGVVGLAQHRDKRRSPFGVSHALWP